MASKNLAGVQLAAWLLDHNQSPEALGKRLGLSGMTLRRLIDGEPVSRSTKWIVARHLGEEPSTLFPPEDLVPSLPEQPGGPRAGQNPSAEEAKRRLAT